MEKSIYDTLNKILSNSNIDSVSSESTGFSELQDGYYLCEVAETEIKKSSNQDPLIVLTMKVIGNGYDAEISNDGEITFKELKGANGSMIWLNYAIKDEKSLKRFVSDMLKFEGDEQGEPLLPKEAFTTPETLEDAVKLLVENRIYVQISTTEKDGKANTWKNLVSWKRVTGLELPQ